MSDRKDQNLRCVYNELCSSYRAIDDFRAKLLALLPLATGTGIFLLISKDFPTGAEKFLEPIGLFGFAITLGLFAYEIHGIKKCDELIKAGKQIESLMNVNGQFISHPHAVLRFINEPFAAGVIYPAVLATWTFLGLIVVDHCKSSGLIVVDSQNARWAALLVFLAGFCASLYYNYKLNSNSKKPATLIGLNQDTQNSVLK